MRGGLLNMQRGGGLLGNYNPIRQTATGGTPGQGGGWMAAGGMGDPSQYGSDAWALQGGGPGGLFLRQLVQGMMGGKNPLNVLDPGKAGKFWSDETIGILRPEFQQAYKKANK